MPFQQLFLGTNRGIQFVGFNSLTATGSGVITVSLNTLFDGISSTPNPDDVVIVGAGTATSLSTRRGTISDASYVQGAFNASVSGSNCATQAVFVKRFGDIPDSSVTVSFNTAAGDSISVMASVWRNVLADNVATDISIAAATGFAAPNPPAVTPSTIGSVVVTMGTQSHIRGFCTFANTGYDLMFTAFDNSSRDISTGLGTLQWVAGSGTIDPPQYQYTSCSDNNAFRSVAHSLILRPRL